MGAHERRTPRPSPAPTPRAIDPHGEEAPFSGRDAKSPHTHAAAQANAGASLPTPVHARQTPGAIATRIAVIQAACSPALLAAAQTKAIPTSALATATSRHARIGAETNAAATRKRATYTGYPGGWGRKRAIS